MGCYKRKYEALLTLTERKTRKEIIVKIDAKASEAVTKAMTKIQKHYGSLFLPFSKPSPPTMGLSLRN